MKKTNSDIITEFAFFFSHAFFFKFYENNKRFIGGYERKRSGRLLTILNTYPDSTKYNKIADRETRCFAAQFIKSRGQEERLAFGIFCFISGAGETMRRIYACRVIFGEFIGRNRIFFGKITRNTTGFGRTEGV